MTEADLARVDEALGRNPLVDEVAALDLGGRPWLVARPDVAALHAARFANVFEALRFRLESDALALPAALRPRGWTIARALLPRDATGAVDRTTLAALVAPAPLRTSSLGAAALGAERDGCAVWPAAPPDDAPLDPVWAAWFRELPPVGDYAEVLAQGTSLEFDLGLDSLDRIDLVLAVFDALGLDEHPDAQAEIYTLGDLVAAARAAGVRRPRGRPRLDRARILAPAGGPVPALPDSRWRPLALAGAKAIVDAVRLVNPIEVVGRARVDWRAPRMIFAQNHVSDLDPILLAWALPRAQRRRAFFLGFTDYFTSGPGARAARLFRIEPISPDAGAVSGLRAAAAAVRAGERLCIYPEGERTWDGTLHPLRRGVAWIARAADAPVVPSAIVGTYPMYPREGSFRRHPVRLAFGAPLAPPSGDDAAADAEFLARLRDALETLVREAGGDPERGDQDTWERGSARVRARP